MTSYSVKSKAAQNAASSGIVGGFNPVHLSESRGGFDGKRIRKAIQRRTVDFNRYYYGLLWNYYGLIWNDMDWYGLIDIDMV